MERYTLVLGEYQTNCYCLHSEDTNRCILVDPGYAPQEILNFLAENQLELEAILLTHGHFDHVGAVKALATETDCAVYLCEKDLSLPPMMTAGTLYCTNLYGEGDVLNFAGLSFRVLHTPGHTPGSVCLICEDTILSGDTLFAGSCGRTDFPGGNMAQMCQSLQRLKNLAGDYTVCPGHGESTTLSQERLYNPYL